MPARPGLSDIEREGATMMYARTIASMAAVDRASFELGFLAHRVWEQEHHGPIAPTPSSDFRFKGVDE